MYQTSLTIDELINKRIWTTISQTTFIIDKLAIHSDKHFPRKIKISPITVKNLIFSSVYFFLVKDNVGRQALIMWERDYTASKYSPRKIDWLLYSGDNKLIISIASVRSIKRKIWINGRIIRYKSDPFVIVYYHILFSPKSSMRRVRYSTSYTI